jgi:hypothetical protein
MTTPSAAEAILHSSTWLDRDVDLGAQTKLEMTAWGEELTSCRLPSMTGYVWNSELASHEQFTKLFGRKVN